LNNSLNSMPEVKIADKLKANVIIKVEFLKNYHTYK
jgi:hypothetical protein